MRGLCKWTNEVERNRSARLKAQKRMPSQGMSLLTIKELTSGSGESAAVHSVQSDPARFGDEPSRSDNDPAVARTVEMLSVAGSDVPAQTQEKEARTTGGIPSQ